MVEEPGSGHCYVLPWAQWRWTWYTVKHGVAGWGSDFRGPLWNGKPTPAYRLSGRDGCGPHRPVTVLGDREKGDSGGNLREEGVQMAEFMYPLN